MNGKQKGFTLIEILVVVTIIGVLAGLVVVLIPKTQEKKDILSCTNNQRQFIGLLVQADQEAWRKSGPNLLLYWVKKGDIKGDQLSLLFCPGDTKENIQAAGGEDVYKNLDLKTQQFGHLTSYAGRDQNNATCAAKQSGDTLIMTCDDSEDHHNAKGFVCGYNDGSVKFIDKVDKWEMDLATVVAVGEGSSVKDLQCMKEE